MNAYKWVTRRNTPTFRRFASLLLGEVVIDGGLLVLDGEQELLQTLETSHLDRVKQLPCETSNNKI